MNNQPISSFTKLRIEFDVFDVDGFYYVNDELVDVVEINCGGDNGWLCVKNPTDLSTQEQIAAAIEWFKKREIVEHNWDMGPGWHRTLDANVRW